MLVPEVSTFIDKVRAIGDRSNSLVARAAAQRLHKAQRQIEMFTPAELYQYIDPASVERSFEREQSRVVQRQLLIRNLLFVLPLILTLLALGLTFIQYRGDVASHPQDANLSFLLLWETGFHTGSTLFAASTIVLLDASLIILGGGVGILAGLQRLQKRKQEQALHDELENALERLSESSLRQMSRLMNPNIAQAQYLDRVNRALEESVKITQNAQVQIVQVAQQMDVFQQSTTSLSQSTARVGQYLSSLEKALQESSSTAIRIETAQNTNATTVATVASRMDVVGSNLSRLGQEISKFLGNLNERYNEIVKVLANLESTVDSLTTYATQVTRQTDQLTTAVNRATATTAQFTETTGSLVSSQKDANQIIQAMLQRLDRVLRETGNSAAALTQLVDSEADTMRATSVLVTRLEIIQQLLGRLVSLAGTGTGGDPFLQGLLGSEQEQQSLGINPLKILSLLQISGTQPRQALMTQVQNLMGDMRLDPLVFSDIITTFSDMGLVTLSGKPGNEQVKLTALGEQVTGTLVSP